MADADVVSDDEEVDAEDHQSELRRGHSGGGVVVGGGSGDYKEFCQYLSPTKKSLYRRSL